MTRPRKALVSVQNTPYYHVVSRCVRRTFLCGIDQHTNRNYEHRRQWIVNRIRLLSSLFSIDVCAYAVMSNHYHIVVKLDPEQAECWHDDDVVERWTSLYKGPLLVRRYQSGEPLAPAELATIADIITVWRQRLTDLSWFMKCLNEPIAREANKEDQCTGHFWESRYKSQALLTEEALLSCMVYVDLNPIRGGLTKVPECSDYTSVQERIAPRFDLASAIKEQKAQSAFNRFDLPLKPLLHFSDSITDGVYPGIPFSLAGYLELVDWTGRAIRSGKRGSIPDSLPPLLQRLSMSPKTWLQHSQTFEQIHTALFRKTRARKKVA
ncbi:hypothetical protein FKG94_28005 [Exilibacterium tricleocarpae]|uniref:Transposase IS200-like domain-containing protein n=1 Tax=Exilibacterium tricleocarpae TaxID=2591008 RepID=A0A545SLJ4_9GAMM|nr:transposase [Exilibacterium tricleocarpae]TQV65831.1 hypothetical protein FKG94_28005 [Exilibacterium tricleocarpae]